MDRPNDDKYHFNHISKFGVHTDAYEILLLWNKRLHYIQLNREC